MPSTFQTRHYEAIASVLIRAKAGVVFSTGLRAPDEILDVLDHMVIGQGRWVSLKERGLGFA